MTAPPANRSWSTWAAAPGFFNLIRIYPTRGVSGAVMGNATSYPIDAVARLALTDWAPGQRYSPNTLICVVGAGSDQIGGATGRVRRAT